MGVAQSLQAQLESRSGGQPAASPGHGRRHWQGAPRRAAEPVQVRHASYFPVSQNIGWAGHVQLPDGIALPSFSVGPQAPWWGGPHAAPAQQILPGLVPVQYVPATGQSHGQHGMYQQAMVTAPPAVSRLPYPHPMHIASASAVPPAPQPMGQRIATNASTSVAANDRYNPNDIALIINRGVVHRFTQQRSYQAAHVQQQGVAQPVEANQSPQVQQATADEPDSKRPRLDSSAQAPNMQQHVQSAEQPVADIIATAVHSAGVVDSAAIGISAVVQPSSALVQGPQQDLTSTPSSAAADNLSVGMGNILQPVPARSVEQPLPLYSNYQPLQQHTVHNSRTFHLSMLTQQVLVGETDYMHGQPKHRIKKVCRLKTVACLYGLKPASLQAGT